MMHDGFGSGFGNYGNWLCGPGAFFPGPLGMILTLLFWGFVIYLVVKLVKTLFKGNQHGSSSHLETLKERYARGEVSEEEYNRMKTELS